MEIIKILVSIWRNSKPYMDNRSVISGISDNRWNSHWHIFKKIFFKTVVLIASLLSNVLIVPSMRLTKLIRRKLNILEMLQAHHFSPIPLCKREPSTFRTRRNQPCESLPLERMIPEPSSSSGPWSGELPLMSFREVISIPSDETVK